MCTSIVKVVSSDGAAKGADGWFPVSQAVVAYDHPRHAPLDDGIAIDFLNLAQGPTARAGVELTLEAAKALRDALDQAIEEAEIEEGLRPAPALAPRAAA